MDGGISDEDWHACVSMFRCLNGPWQCDDRWPVLDVLQYTCALWDSLLKTLDLTRESLCGNQKILRIRDRIKYLCVRVIIDSFTFSIKNEQHSLINLQPYWMAGFSGTHGEFQWSHEKNRFEFPKDACPKNWYYQVKRAFLVYEAIARNTQQTCAVCKTEIRVQRSEW